MFTLLDLRYGFRTLRRAPLLTGVVALVVGGGLGVACAVFALFNAYALRAFPIADPGAVYDFTWASSGSRRHLFTLDEFETLRGENRVFADVYAAQPTTTFVDGTSWSGLWVSGNYFDVLGVEPSVGRTLRPDDAAQPQVLVISHDLWSRRFASDSSILGQSMRLFGVPHEIIGVAAPEFTGIRDYPVDFWVPLESAPPTSAVRRSNAFEVTGRLLPGRSPEQARAQLDIWAQAHALGLPADERPTRILLEPRATRLPLTPAVIGFFTLLLMIVGLILVVACTNVAGIMLVRAAARHREMALRVSLGARRSHLARQLIAEGALLAIPAALIGIAITYGITTVAPAAAAAALPDAAISAMRMLFIRLPIDLQVIGFLIVTTIVAVALFAVGPALKISENLTMAASMRGRPSRLHLVLIGVQLGACVLFVITAAGFMNGAGEIVGHDPRLQIDRVVDIRVAPAMVQRVAGRLRSHPDVVDVAFTPRPPLYGPLDTIAVSAGGITARVGHTVVSPDYFAVFGIPVAAGRTFTDADVAAAAPVAVISLATAQRLFPGRTPLGQRLRIAADGNSPGSPQSAGRDVTVVGIANDVASGLVVDGLDDSVVYLPVDPRNEQLAILVRTRGDARASLAALDSAVAAETADTNRRLAPMADVLRFQAWPLQLFGRVMSALAVFAVLLALSGCYGNLAYVVVQRSREFGVRAALGASPVQLVAAVAKPPMTLAALAVPAGLLVSLAVARVMTSVIAGAPAFGPAAFAMGAVAGLAATVAASLIPSWRVTRIDPVVALRSE